MPEIGEVARIVHFIREHLVGKTLAVVKAQHDENVFGKVGTSAAEFEKHMKGKKIVGAGQQGKYFWITMSSPPHPVLHFGMAGWFHIRGQSTYYHKAPIVDDWPPKYWKFTLETAPSAGSPAVEAAFVDFRRFARIRLVDCAAADLRATSPLKENGPDPVIDKDVVTEAWLAAKCRARRIPIKALLLDQANVSGVGNWVGDEVLYHARIHPEQYSNTLSDAQIGELHRQLHYVCGFACEVLAESERFPEHWLFKHRWGKGKKGAVNRLPNGAKIVFMTVGGRTSAVVPSVQKKTGAVAGDVKKEDLSDSDEIETDEAAPVAKAKQSPKKAKKDETAVETPAKRKRAVKKEESDEPEKEEEEEVDVEDVKPKRAKAAPKPVVKKSATNGGPKSKASAKTAKDPAPASKGKKDVSTIADADATAGRRRSGRLSRG